MKLDGMTAVVTGAASGIGLAITEAMAPCDSRRHRGGEGRSGAHKLRRRGLRADALSLDVTDDRWMLSVSGGLTMAG